MTFLDQKKSFHARLELRVKISIVPRDLNLIQLRKEFDRQIFMMLAVKSFGKR